MSAFKELLGIHFKTYKRIYLKGVTYSCGNHIDAEDIIQDAYVKALDNQDSYTAEYDILKFNTWFFTIVQRAMADYYRKEDIRRHADLRFFQEELEKEYDVEDKAIRELIIEREIINKQHIKKYGVVYDRIVLGLPFETIADKRNVPMDVALQRVGRFKKELGVKYESLHRGSRS